MIRAGLFAWNAVCFFALTLISAPRALAANEGQADLDKATELQITAQAMSDLGKVAELCESALKKGLDEGNQAFAKQLLSSTLYQFAEQLTGPIFDKEMRVSSRRRRNYVLRFLYIGLFTLLLALIWAESVP